MKLTKIHESEEKVSIIPRDIIYYKDESGIPYKLKYLRSRFENYTDYLSKLHRVCCLSKYATYIIEGKVIFESDTELHIEADKGIYEFKKPDPNWDEIDWEDKSGLIALDELKKEREAEEACLKSIKNQ